MTFGDWGLLLKVWGDDQAIRPTLKPSADMKEVEFPIDNRSVVFGWLLGFGDSSKVLSMERKHELHSVGQVLARQST